MPPRAATARRLYRDLLRQCRRVKWRQARWFAMQTVRREFRRPCLARGGVCEFDATEDQEREWLDRREAAANATSAFLREGDVDNIPLWAVRNVAHLASAVPSKGEIRMFAREVLESHQAETQRAESGDEVSRGEGGTSLGTITPWTDTEEQIGALLKLADKTSGGVAFSAAGRGVGTAGARGAWLSTLVDVRQYNRRRIDRIRAKKQRRLALQLDDGSSGGGVGRGGSDGGSGGDKYDRMLRPLLQARAQAQRRARKRTKAVPASATEDDSALLRAICLPRLTPRDRFRMHRRCDRLRISHRSEDLDEEGLGRCVLAWLPGASVEEVDAAVAATASAAAAAGGVDMLVLFQADADAEAEQGEGEGEGEGEEREWGKLNEAKPSRECAERSESSDDAAAAAAAAAAAVEDDNHVLYDSMALRQADLHDLRLGVLFFSLYDATLMNRLRRNSRCAW